MARRQYAEAYAQGRELLTLAEQANAELHPVLVVAGNYVLGVTTFWQGEFLLAQSNTWSKRSLRMTEQQHDSLCRPIAQDLGVVCLIRLAYLLWYLGYPHQAHDKDARRPLPSRASLPTRLP